MKTLKQLREEYDSNYLPQELPEELVLEAKHPEFKHSDSPSPYVMPTLLMFRRITYKKYPNNQTVALYYSKTVDKYLSIPFGPTGNLNLSESSIYDTYEDFELNEGAKWEAVKGGVKGAIQGGMKGFYVGNAIAADAGMAIGTPVGAAIGAYKGAKKAYKNAKEKELSETEAWQRKEGQSPTGGLNKKGIASYRRANPGSKLSMAVTTKPSKLKPGSKASNRRKSFCARMGGMKGPMKDEKGRPTRKALALRKWNCEEDFKMKLYEMRMQRNEGVLGALDTAADAFVPYYSAGKKAVKGDWKGAATDAAIDTGLMAATGGVGKLAAGAGKLALKGIAKGGLKRTARRAAIKVGGKEAAKSPLKYIAKKGAGAALDALASDKKGDDSGDKYGFTSPDVKKAQAKVYTPSMQGGESAVDTARKSALVRKDYESSGKKQVAENRMSDLRNMINEGIDKKDLNINGRSITLNTGMAKRILEVYDSVNSKNKKIVENMLNEDLESFKRLLTFSIRN